MKNPKIFQIFIDEVAFLEIFRHRFTLWINLKYFTSS